MSDVHVSVEQGNITRNPGGRMEKCNWLVSNISFDQVLTLLCGFASC